LDMIHNRAAQLDELDRRLKRSTRELVSRFQSETKQLSSALDALSPLKVLSRGYSITRVETGKQPAETEIVKSIKQLNPGDTLQTHVSDGTIISQVQEIAEATQLETTD